MTRKEKKEELIRLFCIGAITIGDLIDECFEFGQQHPRWISVEDELPKEGDMDYKEKYNAALERAKKLQKTCDSMAVVGWCEYIFPELAESEDERIRKELIEQVAYIIPNDDEVDSEGNALSTYQKRIDKYRAWLEKQGEQNFDYEHADIPQKDFAPIEQKTLNAEKQGHMLDTNKVIEWLCSNSTLFGAKWCKTENIIEQFKKDFGL